MSSKKPKKAKAPHEQLRDEVKNLRRQTVKAFNWQKELNQQILERLGEVEAYAEELAACNLKAEEQPTPESSASTPRRASRTNSRIASDSLLADASANSSA